jgi:hypothetical protein
LLKPIAILALASAISDTAGVQDIRAALAALHLRSALVVESQEVDEHPVWSPDGKALAVNLAGKWHQIDLGAVSLTPAQWHGGSPIGKLVRPLPSTVIEDNKVNKWEKSNRWDPRRIETKDGTILALTPDELSTVFTIGKKTEKPQVLWKTALENCHSLSLSPDEQHVAYICELNGVVVTALSPVTVPRRAHFVCEDKARLRPS